VISARCTPVRNVSDSENGPPGSDVIPTYVKNSRERKAHLSDSCSPPTALIENFLSFKIFALKTDIMFYVYG